MLAINVTRAAGKQCNLPVQHAADKICPRFADGHCNECKTIIDLVSQSQGTNDLLQIYWQSGCHCQQWKLKKSLYLYIRSAGFRFRSKAVKREIFFARVRKVKGESFSPPHTNIQCHENVWSRRIHSSLSLIPSWLMVEAKCNLSQFHRLIRFLSM